MAKFHNSLKGLTKQYFDVIIFNLYKVRYYDKEGTKNQEEKTNGQEV